MCYNWLLVYHMHGRCRGFCFVMFSCFLLCHYHLLLYNSSCAATFKVGPSKLRPYSRGTRKATLSGGALIPCCLLKSSSPCRISSWSIVESHPSSLTFFHLQKAQTKLTGVDDFQRFLSCMVTRHWYSMYCTSSTVTIGNTETPLPSLLVSSWRRVGHPKMPSLFGENVTLRPSCTIQSRNEDNVSWPSGRKNVTKNRKTAGSHSSPSIALKTPLQTHSSIHKRPQMWNFGPSKALAGIPPKGSNPIEQDVQMQQRHLCRPRRGWCPSPVAERHNWRPETVEPLWHPLWGLCENV